MREPYLSAASVLVLVLSSPAASAQPADPPLPAATREAPTSGEKAGRAELLALAEAMAPRDIMLRNEMDLFNRQFAAELRKQQAFRDMEEQYPGLIPELERELKLPFERYMGRMLDSYFAEVATLLGDSLDASGVAALTRYYQSEPGQRLVRAIIENYDQTELVETYSKGEEADPAMLKRGLEGAAAKASAAMTPEDQTALILLMKEPAFWTLRKINPRILEIRARVMNADDPMFEEEVAAVFERVLTNMEPGEAVQEQ